MAHLALIASNPAHLPAAQAMHDLRNILASIGLHLETLGRLSGPSGAKPMDAAYALLTRCTAMCNCALDYAANAQSRRCRVDLIHTARQAADLLAPSAPRGFCFDIGRNIAACAVADPNDVFRIVFNLMSNAVNLANLKANAIKTVTVRVSIEGATLTMQISDDGPGLPAWLRTRLFRARSKQSHSPRHGYGLAIARELAERNGGTLTLAPSAGGTTFELKLAAFVSMLPEHAPARIPGRDPCVASFADCGPPPPAAGPAAGEVPESQGVEHHIADSLAGLPRQRARQTGGLGIADMHPVFHGDCRR
jgi:signal transduction histidine kinase